jgi:hypothetical protein
MKKYAEVPCSIAKLKEVCRSIEEYEKVQRNSGSTKNYEEIQNYAFPPCKGIKRTKGSELTKGTKGTKGSEITKGTKRTKGAKRTKRTKGTKGTKGSKRN